jgi:hypothetical protein
MVRVGRGSREGVEIERVLFVEEKCVAFSTLRCGFTSTFDSVRREMRHMDEFSIEQDQRTHIFVISANIQM